MVITFNEMDPKFKYEISKIPGAEKTMLCFQCGTCTAGCPISKFSEYKPRKLMLMVQLGLKSKVFSSDFIWLCSSCFICVDRCPQDVDIANIVRALRNMAVKEGYLPTVYKELASSVLKTGYAYKIPDIRQKKRGEEGLPQLPRANLENIRKLFEITFPKIIFERRTQNA